ncbi:glycosyltransferase [Dehalococcoidia bacterium]|nr:glycosyltransferase [Dehalococcoidia bacterium]
MTANSTSSSKQPVIFVYAPAWDGASQVSKHHLARYWASRGRRVLYVEAPFHPFSLATRPGETRRMWSRFLHSPVNVEPNIWVQACPVLYPYRAGWPLSTRRWLLKFNHFITRLRLKAVCRKLGLDDPMVVVSSPLAEPVLDSVEASMTLYHCSDDFAMQPRFPDSCADLERRVFARSDLVVCTAETLRQAKDGMHPRCYTVTNGAQIDHFARTRLPEVEVAPELRKLPGPIIGYIGSVFEWLDQPMIANAAKSHPDWSFVFVGPITTNVSTLKGLANVHFLGPRPYQDIPTYLKGFDVATVPFILHDVTMRASPVKFYEYLASGVPVVATRLPDFQAFAHLSGLISTQDEFVTALEQALQDDDGQIQARTAEARNHSWEARFGRIDELIDETLVSVRSAA